MVQCCPFITNIKGVNAVMMSREEFDAHLVAIVSGNWESFTRILHYFGVDGRIFQTPSPQKVVQISQCYSYMSTASINNNPFAITFFGVMLEQGYGVTKDVNQAIAKYRIAAENFNNPWGQYYLGLYYIEQSEKSFFASSKQSEKARALGLFLKAANQGHGQSAYQYARHIDIPSEKDKWNRIARENGSHSALYDTICPKSWGNPLRLYIPKNKAMTCQSEAKKEVSSVSTYSGSVNYEVQNYRVTIFYENEVILSKNIDNTYPSAYAKTLSLAKFDMKKVIPMGIIATLTCPITVPLLCCMNCCTTPGSCNCMRETYKDDKDRARIASSINTVTWEQNISQLIREADGVISQRLEQRRNSRSPYSPPQQYQYPQPPIQLMPSPTQPPVAPEIKLTPEQFNTWMAAQGLRQQAAAAPQQQSMEGQPLLYNPNLIPVQSPPPIYVSPQQGYNPQFFMQPAPVQNVFMQPAPLPSAPMTQGMQMAMNNPGQSIRLPSGAVFKFG